MDMNVKVGKVIVPVFFLCVSLNEITMGASLRTNKFDPFIPAIDFKSTKMDFSVPLEALPALASFF